MSVIDGGIEYGCSNDLEARASGISYAGRDLANILRKGGKPPATYTIHGTVFDVKVVKATADGTTDNQAALSSALGAARNGTPTLVVLPPAATWYRYSNMLTMSDDTHLVGYGATLQPLSVEYTRIGFGNRCSVAGLNLFGVDNLSYSKWPERSEESDLTAPGSKNGAIANEYHDGDRSAWINIFNRKDAILIDVETKGSIQGTVRIGSTTNALIERCSAYRTHSDSFHIIKACQWVTVRSCNVYFPGDDGISIIQYKDSPGGAQPSNILVEDCRMVGGRARGFTCVSGRDILYRRNICEQNNGAPYRFGPTTAHSVAPTENIKVQDCEAWRCPRLQTTSGHSAPLVLLLSTPDFACTGVEITRTHGYQWNDYSGVGREVVRQINNGKSISFVVDKSSSVTELDASA